ncbi:alpha-ketoglutarate-dependent dioxygenase AlkB [Rhodanobacter sp. A1T4]|uniref:alpha-ketoglutarate-dependent dioxygenase AlkB family protein n=1 Tax=Rhodanobacter sp. A1T4 TaxID=2723087 RepID=UPI0017FC2370|nr:alpha-ketoglutarate-dependent dioxygenase AlkB [Rhodanobacter sp. A1T4]MBB6249017.1 alkylated DNA repair dioxygenase AlkB [Rhodanobacter sp. A1T4]
MNNAQTKSMVQTSLFGANSASLLSGDEGEVSYYPNVISPEKAARWFAYFHERTTWQAERRQMYDREIDVPRLHIHFSLDDNVAPPLREAFSLVTHYLRTPFNSVGLNLYRDKHDSVAPHNDKLEFLRAGPPIALLSLGATRRMIIRQKKAPRQRLNVDLEAGSLLVMSWTSQLHYDHGIPKERDTVGPRISLAFRVSRT